MDLIFDNFVWLIRQRLRKNRVSSSSYIKNPRSITLGKNSTITKGCSLDASGGGWIKIGDRVTLNRLVYLNAYKGHILIEDGVEINNLTVINGTGGVTIQRDVLIGPNVQIISYAHRFNNSSLPIKEQGIDKKPVIIEQGCWIGAGAIILAGVTIGEHSVIGAGAVVNKNIPPFSVAVGVPAKIIKNRKEISHV